MIGFQNWWFQKWLIYVVFSICTCFKPPQIITYQDLEPFFFFFLSSPKKAFVIPNNYVCIWLSPNCLDWISFASLHLPFSTSPKHCCTVWSLILFIGLLVSLGQYHSFTLSWRPLTFSFIIVLAFLGSLLFHLHFLNVKKPPFYSKKNKTKNQSQLYTVLYTLLFSVKNYLGNHSILFSLVNRHLLFLVHSVYCRIFHKSNKFYIDG